MAAPLAARFEFLRRMMRRPGRESGRVVLDRRRIYILPTRTGVVFALTCLAMLIGATNYGNNLVYALTFLMSGVGFVSMLHTWRNLAGLTLQAGRAEPVFAGGAARFPVELDGAGGRPRWAVALLSGSHVPVAVDLAAGSVAWCELELPALRRGMLPLGRITVAGEYPLGLFRAWSYVELAEASCLVYPAPAPHHPLPALSGAGTLVDSASHRGGDDFVGLRPYQAGDSLRQIHWKALAHGDQLQVKRFGGEAGQELWLSWDELTGLDTEARLSQLCRWVLDAETIGARYGLALPDQRLPLDHGGAHRDRCLTALALFGIPQ